MSEKGFDFKTVFGRPYMTMQDVQRANIALDILYAEEKKALDKAKAKGKRR